jgi:hypothetical protein
MNIIEAFDTIKKGQNVKHPSWIENLIGWELVEDLKNVTNKD